jgi:ADP-heptose:LPS heptosyltransferase
LKILFIRFSSIGDIVLTTPLLRCVKKQIPGAEIHYLTKASYYEILCTNPNIDKIYTFNENYSELIKQLKSENYSSIIDLHKNIRSFRIKSSLLKPSYSFPKLNFAKWLLVNFKINLLPDIHIVNRYFKALEKLNVRNDNEGLDFFINEADMININLLPINFHKGYKVLVVGGNHFTKKIPDDILLTLCKKTEIPLVLIGGKEDRPRAEEVRKKADNKDVFNACGIYNVGQSASIIEQSKGIITPDTGMMHIAAALKKNILSVWGNTVPEFGMYPYLPASMKNLSKIVEVKNLSCRPCSKIGFKKCPKKHFNCMKLNDINTLINFLKNE